MRIKNQWGNAAPINGLTFTCPHCGATHTPLHLVTGTTQVVPPKIDYWVNAEGTQVLACTACTMPYINVQAHSKTIPSVRLGANLKNIPDELAKLYNEARDASSVGAYTACAMVARKALMNLAVLEGAEQDKNFHYYVQYLADNGFVPPKGKPWVDKIRTTGNAATHEIEIVSEAGARDVVYLLENLLRFNFEMTGS